MHTSLFVHFYIFRFLSDARTNLTQALELRIELYGEENAEVATSLDQLGWLAKNTGELPGAIQYFTQALKIQKKLFGNRHEEVASSLNGLGSILCELGDLAKARTYFDEALSIGTELFGNNHPNVAQSLHNLGTTFSLLSYFLLSSICLIFPYLRHMSRTRNAHTRVDEECVL